MEEKFKDENFYSKVRELAFSYWEREGCPDGEVYKDSKFGKMRIKEIHWFMAQHMITSLYDTGLGTY